MRTKGSTLLNHGLAAVAGIFHLPNVTGREAELATARGSRWQLAFSIWPNQTHRGNHQFLGPEFRINRQAPSETADPSAPLRSGRDDKHARSVCATCQMPMRCQVPNANAKCQVPNAKCQCQVPNAKCQMPSAKCQMPSAYNVSSFPWVCISTVPKRVPVP